jgi:Rieske Fe-S protein
MNPDFDCAGACPHWGGRSSAFDFPVGQVRRVAAVDPDQDVDETKRNVLKLLAVAGIVGAGAGGLVGGTLQFVQPPTVGLTSYPVTQLLDVDGSALTIDKVQAEYDVTTPNLYLFNYPLRNEPNFLLNLYPPTANGPPSPTNPGAENVYGGVGDHKSIVAYSAICQHLGCPAPAIAYYPPGTCPQTFPSSTNPSGTFYIHCSCHGSTYDVTNAAANLTGPAVIPLPQVILDVDASSGNISAVGMMGAPVNGHLNTLQGDYGVGTTSQVAKETPVILCSFGLPS